MSWKNDIKEVLFCYLDEFFNSASKEWREFDTRALAPKFGMSLAECNRCIEEYINTRLLKLPINQN